MSHQSQAGAPSSATDVGVSGQSGVAVALDKLLVTFNYLLVLKFLNY